MTMSQLLLAPEWNTVTKRADCINALDYLSEIHEAGAVAYSEGVQPADCPYTFQSLECVAWRAGWDYAKASDDFEQECVRG